MAESTPVVVALENVGKHYSIGAKRSRYATLRESIMELLTVASRRQESGKKGRRSDEDNHLWALRDVSFSITQGEVVGIIGRNGAGKSTLLKILARITEPSAGRVRLHGRVGSLLEVGTGFHPELTGRENVFLSGSILGMKRAEIIARFDEIVSFSGVERFIDTPVKRYSSGMMVRLAFAVAAHLEPEILLIDEVLAVGDAAFQRKCLGKLESVAKEGRTVIFVSHNMGLVQALCDRAVFLRHGAMYADGPAANVVSMYLQSLEEHVDSADLLTREERQGPGDVKLARIDVRAGEGLPQSTLSSGQFAQFTFHVTQVLPGLSCSFTIYDQQGQPVTYFDSAIAGNGDSLGHASNELVCMVQQCLLIPGRYRVNAALYLGGEMQDHLEGAVFFDVIHGSIDGRNVAEDAGYGSVAIPHRWRLP